MFWRLPAALKLNPRPAVIGAECMLPVHVGMGIFQAVSKVRDPAFRFLIDLTADLSRPHPVRGEDLLR